jgi:N-acetylglucosamine kinase-like BadF-type ATPase
MKDISATLAANIRRRRRELHLTQAQLAESLGYSEKAVSKWEGGKGLPPTAILPKLAQVLELTLDELMLQPSAEQLYLGIDGGGTKTDFVLADGEGTVLRELRLGSSNPNDVGLAATEELLRKGISEICEGYPRSSISVYAGLAGGTTSEVAEKLRVFLSRFGFARADNGSDARNAVSAGLGADDGVVVIMGTGSVAFAQSGKKQYRLGGYGYLLGDGGSGFALGRAAVLAALQYEDGSGEETALHALVLEKCGGQTVLERLGSFYEGGKALIATYAPLLFRAVEQGDAVATRLLKEQMQEIARLIRGAARRFCTDTVRVVLCGGLAEANQAFILPVLGDILKNSSESYRLSVCKTSMVEGALYLAGMPRKKEES